MSEHGDVADEQNVETQKRGPVIARLSVLYILIFLNLIVLLGNVIGAIVLGNLRDDVRQSAVSVNTGCHRGNVQRDSVRFLLKGRLHDSQLVASASTNAVIKDYFADQAVVAQKKLNAAIAASAATFPDPKDPYLVDCDKSFPLP